MPRPNSATTQDLLTRNGPSGPSNALGDRVALVSSLLVAGLAGSGGEWWLRGVLANGPLIGHALTKATTMAIFLFGVMVVSRWARPELPAWWPLRWSDTHSLAVFVGLAVTEIALHR